MNDEEIIAYLKNFFNVRDYNQLKILADSMNMHFKNDAAFLRAFMEDTDHNNEIIETKIMKMLKCDLEDDLIYQAISQAENLNREIMDEVREGFNNNTLDISLRDYFESHMDELQSNQIPEELYDPLLLESHDLVLEPIINHILSRSYITTMRPPKRY